MNNEQPVTEEQKSSVTKGLAILGFLALIILMVWLAVKIVAFVPGAFSSLASIADSVYNYQNEETVTLSTSKSVVNTSESLVVNWDTLRTPGTYTFSYACIDGVSLEIRDQAGNITALPCNTALPVDGTNSLDIRTMSEKNRFTDITYELTFTPSDSRQPIQTTSNVVTVVNATIPTQVATADDEETTEDEETPSTPTDVAADDATTPAAPSTPTTPPVRYTEQTVYYTPVSDPNGTVDLRITYKGVGIIENNRFVKAGSIDTNEKGAIQFEVHNTGTKTADVWSFVAELPSDITYKSDTQKALKPNERALFTLGFEGISKKGIESFSVTVSAPNDINRTNNTFNWAVTID
jgi:hypothetical protein